VNLAVSKDALEELESEIFTVPVKPIIFYQYCNFDSEGNVKWEKKAS
jgi:hypothetical protein